MAVSAGRVEVSKGGDQVHELDDCRTKLPLNLFHLPHRSLLELARFFMVLSNLTFERAAELREEQCRNMAIAVRTENLSDAGSGKLIDETIPGWCVEANAKAHRQNQRLAKKERKGRT